MRWATVARVAAVVAALAIAASCKMPLDVWKSGSGTGVSSGGPAGNGGTGSSDSGAGSSGDAVAAPITLAWDPAAGVCAGYKVHMGTASRQYVTSINAGNSTTCVVSTLKKGSTYFFAVSAYAADGTESELSNEVQYTPPG